MAVDRQDPPHYAPDPSLEYHALKRCLRPMPDDTDRRVAAKFIAVILVGTWLTITAAVAFEQAVVPPHWLPFTALVFLLVGRLWNLEVEQLLPGSYGSTQQNTADEDREGDNS